MIWLSWRLQRTETLIAAALLALLAALLVPTGIQMASAYHHDGLAACLAANQSYDCGNALGSFTARFESLRNIIDWLTLLPGLVGVMLAAPFILDLEKGTYRLAWTQSITRRRWIAGRLGLGVGVAMLAAFALALLLTWWRTPWVHLEGRMQPSAYDSEGIVIYGYALFALGLALAIGVVWRRAVPALVVAFLGYFAARLFVDTWLRQRLVKPLTSTWSMRQKGPNLDHAWVLTQGPSDKFGHILDRPGPCGGPVPGAHVGVEKACLAQGHGYMHAVYHPASHFWALQSVETALFAGTALVMIGFAAWWTWERAA
jgi:hypothetical protein